jgi:hypothetical protein
MEAARASRGSIVLAALAAALAAGMLWASIALAGGSSSSASTPNTPASGPVAYMGGPNIAAAPQQHGGTDENCPNMGGDSSGSQDGGSSSPDTSSTL